MTTVTTVSLVVTTTAMFLSLLLLLVLLLYGPRRLRTIKGQSAEGAQADGHDPGQGLSPTPASTLHTRPTQRLQNPLVKEYTLNLIRVPIII